MLEEGISHHVTPLWCAAVSGRLAVVKVSCCSCEGRGQFPPQSRSPLSLKVLLRHGADVDAVSDSGSTPIRSACYIVRHGMNTAHFDIIRL